MDSPVTNVSFRTLSDVKSTLECAKLDAKDIQEHLSQVISFDPNFSGTELRLLELNPELLKEVQVGTRLAFRGNPEDQAVLCTGSCTFEVKEAETSNSLLILQKLEFPTSPCKIAKASSEHANVVGSEQSSIHMHSCEVGTVENVVDNRSILRVAHSYFECQRTRPNLARLNQILEPTTYKGQARENSLTEENTPSDFVTFDILLQQVPASAQEIQTYLDNKMKCVELDGYIRLLDKGYVMEVLTQILKYTDENRNVSKEYVISDLSSLHSKIVLERVLEWFFMDKEDEQGLKPMNEFEVCRFMGECLVKAATKFCINDFMSHWQGGVPSGLKVNIKQLDGIAICDKESSPPVIWYFPEEALPDNLTERFMTLFQTKSKWRQDEIFPYIETVTTSSQNVGSLLTKFARVHTENGIKYYSAKHSK